MTIIDHLENFLGEIAQGWRDEGAAKGERKLTAARFADTPFEGRSTYATIGLSDHSLYLANGREMRQELIFAAHDDFPADAVASFLLSFAGFVLSKHWAVARGDVIGPGAPLIPGFAANAVYVCSPDIFPPGLEVFRVGSSSAAVAWIVPLVGDESAYAKKVGRDRFEALLKLANPDLFDLNRRAVAEL